jgi:hypothetical protein
MPHEWANSCIELSSNNAAATSVTATFTFHHETALTSGLLEITFPTGFTPNSAGAAAASGYTASASG